MVRITTKQLKEVAAVTNIPTPTAAGVWKPPKDETAGKGTY
jgi:hypothetical protein